MLAYIRTTSIARADKGRKINASVQIMPTRFQLPNREVQRSYVQPRGRHPGWGTGTGGAAPQGHRRPAAVHVGVVRRGPDRSQAVAVQFVRRADLLGPDAIALDRIAASDPSAQAAVFHHDSPFRAWRRSPTATVDSRPRLPSSAYKDTRWKGRRPTTVGLAPSRPSYQGARFIVIQNVLSSCRHRGPVPSTL